MTSKHILIITHNDFPVFEGLSVRIENIALVYVNNGHKVTIFAPNIEKKQIKEEMYDNRYKILRMNIPVLRGLLRHRIVMRAYSMILQTILTIFVYFKYLKTEKIEIIQAEQIYSIPSALIIKALTGARIFVDDITTVSDMLRSEGHSIAARIFTFMERILFCMCDEFIYTSDVCRDYCIKRGGNVTIFLPNGVDCNKFSPGDSERKAKKVIFFNCSTYSYQNIQAIKNFLAIGRLLREQLRVPFIFHLVSSPARNIPTKLIEDIQKEREWFFFEDGVSDIVPKIRDANVAAIPYSTGHHITGGVRLKALEYMACGKLVISTFEGVEGIKGLISGRDVIITGVPEDMVPVLSDILRDYEKFDGISKAGRLFVEENYDWNKVMRPALLRLQTN